MSNTRITVTQYCQFFDNKKTFNTFLSAKKYSIKLYRKEPAIRIEWYVNDIKTDKLLESGDASDFFAIEEFEINQNQLTCNS